MNARLAGSGTSGAVSALDFLRRSAGYVLLAGVLAWAVFQKTEGATEAIRALASLVFSASSVAMVLALNRHDLLPTFRRWLMLACVSAGLVYGMLTPPASTYVESANVQKTDGSVSKSQPAVVAADGNSFVPSYTLHPAFDGGHPPYLLSAALPADIGSARLRITKPPSLVRRPDGSPAPGDGVSIVVTGRDLEGAVQFQQRWNVGAERFRAEPWLELRLWKRAAMAAIQVEVLNGPPGSTSLNDTTLVAIQLTSLRDQYHAAASAILLSLTLFVTLMTLGAAKQHLRGRGAFNAMPSTWRATLGWGLIFLALCGGTYWVQRHTTFIYFWDYRNYWEKTEWLLELMKSGRWEATRDAIAASLSDNYSLLPAIPLAFMGLLWGSESSAAFTLQIVAIYVFPALLATAWIAQRIFTQLQIAPSRRFAGTSAIGAVALVGFPAFLGTALLLIPDMGGVAIMAIALAAGSRILENMVTHATDEASERAVRSSLVASGLLLGTSLAFMFLFRRWYAFFAAGMVVALSVRVLVLGYQNRADWSRVMQRTAWAGSTTVAAALAILIWPLSKWLADPVAHDYGTLYASYDFPLSHTWWKLRSMFGTAHLVVALVGIVALAREKQRSELFNLLWPASVVAVFLFLRIQTPGRHHFYLLMPLLCVGLAGALWKLRANGRQWLAALLAAGLVGGGLLMPRPGGVPLFPSYTDWMPRKLADAPVLKDIGRWLRTPENSAKTYCVIASSMSFNQDMVRNIGQIDPSIEHNSLGLRLVPMGEVDSVHGAPSRRWLNCDLAITTEPFLHHLPEKEQLSLRSILDDLSTHQRTGLSFEKVQEPHWTLSNGATVTVYRRTRPTSESEFQALLDHYEAQKAGTSATPHTIESDQE